MASVFMEPSVLLRKAPRCEFSLKTLLPQPEREAPARFQAAGLENGVFVGCRLWSGRVGGPHSCRELPGPAF